MTVLPELGKMARKQLEPRALKELTEAIRDLAAAIRDKASDHPRLCGARAMSIVEIDHVHVCHEPASHSARVEGKLWHTCRRCACSWSGAG